MNESNTTPALAGAIRSITKNWPLASAIAVSVFVAAAFNTLRQTKIYRAVATVVIDPTPPRPLGKDMQSIVEVGANSYWANREYYQTQFKVITSRRVAEKTVRLMGLQNNGAFLANIPAAAAAKTPGVQASVAADILRSRLDVEPVKDSRLVVVSYEDANPERARQVLTTLLETYIEQNVDEVMESSAKAGEWLHGQLGKLRTDLETSEFALHTFKMDKQILSVSIDAQSNILREELQTLSDALTKLKIQEQTLASRQAQLAQSSDADPLNLPAAEYLQSQLLDRLRTDFAIAKQDREALLSRGKGLTHPDVAAAQARFEAIRAAVVSEVSNIRHAVDGDLYAIRRQLNSISGLVEAAKKQGLDLNLLEIEYNRLIRAKNNNEKLYSVVLERSKESDLTSLMRFNNLRFMDRPLVPATPIKPNVPLSLGLGLAGGILLGCFAAFSREWLDRSIKTPQDVEATLGLASLGVIPQVQELADGGRRRRGESAHMPELVVHEFPNSGIAEAVRSIRTNIMFMSPDQPQRRLLITSAGPSEGKTTIACCIATAMAQANQSVLLIDCDLRRPRLHRIFNRTNDFGVSSAVLAPERLHGVDLSTVVPNLSMLPSGPQVPNPAELLQTEAFKKLLAQLCSKYDRVIIDSPPLLPVTDAAVLATQVDGTILVVRGFATSRDLALHATKSLRDVSAKMVGVVLNAIDQSRHSRHSQYYYHRSSSYSYSQRPPAA